MHSQSAPRLPGTLSLPTHECRSSMLGIDYDSATSVFINFWAATNKPADATTLLVSALGATKNIKCMFLHGMTRAWCALLCHSCLATS